MKNLNSAYKEEYKDSVNNPISVQLYREIIHKYFDFIFDKILIDKEEVMLPCKCGSLTIRGRKQKIKVDEKGNVTGLAPDWVKTKALWEKDPEAKENKTLIYFTNEHSDYIRYKYFWSKKGMFIENKDFYNLRLTRTRKRAVPKLVKEGETYNIKRYASDHNR